MAPVQRPPTSSTARWKREQTVETLSAMAGIFRESRVDTTNLLKYTNLFRVSPVGEVKLVTGRQRTNV